MAFTLTAQTEEELKSQKAEKETALGALEAQVTALKGEIAGIDAQLQVFPRWEKGAFGLIGASFNGFSDVASR